MFNQVIQMSLKEAGQSESLPPFVMYVGTSWSWPLSPRGDLASLPEVLGGMGKAED